MEIYTDQEQCSSFGVSYNARGAYLVIRADVLLGSKDYDEAHRAYLSPMGLDTLVLRRPPTHQPGWWVVEMRIPAHHPGTPVPPSDWWNKGGA